MPNPHPALTKVGLGANLFFLAFALLGVAVNLRMMALVQPAEVRVVEGSAALVPGLEPAQDSWVGGPLSGSRKTSAGGRVLAVTWSGPTPSEAEGAVEELLAATFDLQIWDRDAIDVRGHEGLRFDLDDVEAGFGEGAAWICPETLRAFVVMSFSMDLGLVSADLDEALALVECHGHGSVDYPRLEWTPPDGWVMTMSGAGMDWYEGPDQMLGLALASVTSTDLAGCKRNIGSVVGPLAESMELEAVGEVRLLEPACAAEMDVRGEGWTSPVLRVALEPCLEGSWIRQVWLYERGSEPLRVSDAVCEG